MSASLSTTQPCLILFICDPLWVGNSQLMLSLETKLERMGHDTFKAMLNFLTDYDLINSVSYSQTTISKHVEEILRKRLIIVKRTVIMKNTGRFLFQDKATELILTTYTNPCGLESAKELSSKSTLGNFLSISEELTRHIIYTPRTDLWNSPRLSSSTTDEQEQGRQDLFGTISPISPIYGPTRETAGLMDTINTPLRYSTTSMGENSKYPTCSKSSIAIPCKSRSRVASLSGNQLKSISRQIWRPKNGSRTQNENTFKHFSEDLRM